MSLDPDIAVKDATGATRNLHPPLPPGRASAAESRPMVLSVEDKASLDAISTALADIPVGGDASAANQTVLNTAFGAQSAATWDGAAAAPAMSIWRYIGVKIEAVRALLATQAGYLDGIEALLTSIGGALAGTLTVATHAVTQSGNWVLSAGTALIGKVGIDQTTPGVTDHVTGSGFFLAVAGTVTRPADTTAYAVGDLIANNTTAGSVTPIAIAAARANDKTGMIRALRLKVNDTAWKAGTVRVHLFKDSPTVTVGDNGALNVSETYAFSESNYLGYCDITLSQQTSDGFVKGFGVRSIGAEWNFEPATGTQNIFALLEARTAVTPGSGKVFSLVAEVLQN